MPRYTVTCPFRPLDIVTGKASEHQRFAKALHCLDRGTCRSMTNDGLAAFREVQSQPAICGHPCAPFVNSPILRAMC